MLSIFMRLTYIQTAQRAVLYRNGDAVRVLTKGWHLLPAWPLPYRVEVFNIDAPWLDGCTEGSNLAASGEELDRLLRRGVLGGHAETVEIGDDERALVWVDGRYSQTLGPGRYAYWLGATEVRVERCELSAGRIAHRQIAIVLEVESGRRGLIQVADVPSENLALVYRNGELLETLTAGRYGYWLGLGRLSVRLVDLREQVLDIAGQELMTADKVTLRLNATLGYRVSNAELAQQVTQEPDQALYREAQLALRAVVGSKDLETLLADRESVAEELASLVADRANSMGLTVTTLGIRDVVLPGEMKTILNRVMEAKRAAEANLITRREETAAMRSQANTARMLESNPTLMRLRELEVLEKVADKANLQVVLSEGGLTDRLMKLV